MGIYEKHTGDMKKARVSTQLFSWHYWRCSTQCGKARERDKKHTDYIGGSNKSALFIDNHVHVEN